MKIYFSGEYIEMFYLRNDRLSKKNIETKYLKILKVVSM